MKISLKSSLILLLLGAVSCTNSPFPGYEKTESGLYYQLIPSDTPGVAVVDGDIVTLKLKYATSTDSVLFDSDKTGNSTRLKVLPSKYKGDIMEGFPMLHVGDSAVFITSADSFFLKIANMERPAYIDSNSHMTFYIKVENTQSEEDLMAEREAEAAQLAAAEMQNLQAYIAENAIATAPMASGLYYIENKKGTGAAVERGNTVRVHYKGALLDGRVFDSSYDRDEPLEFSIGTGQVIPGWDEGIGYMKVGGKAQLIVPSQLAYGGQAPPGSIITPYSTLVFDVELISVK
jgi:FKBP-type peptidyl-prolyl cis-trans isomerase FkpA